VKTQPLWRLWFYRIAHIGEFIPPLIASSRFDLGLLLQNHVQQRINLNLSSVQTNDLVECLKGK
jgi:hypothetical protein